MQKPMRARTRATRLFSDIADLLIGSPVECVKCPGAAHIIAASLCRLQRVGDDTAAIEVEALCQTCGYATIFFVDRMLTTNRCQPSPETEAIECAA